MTATTSHHPAVLAAVDGSDQADLACRIAAQLAAAWHGPLHLVHAWRPSLPAVAYGGLGSGVVLTQDTVEVLHEGAVAVMQQARAVVRKEGCTAVEHLVEATDTADAILDVAATVDASLVVAGRRGLGPVRRALFGSVSEALLHRSTRPLLLLHGDAACWPPRTVVAAVDGSREATRAARLGAGITATIEDRGDALRRLTGAAVRARVDLAAPLPAILSALSAWPAPVVVAMGTHGRGAAHRAVLGSVATSVLHDDTVTSAVIVPPTTRRRH